MFRHPRMAKTGISRSMPRLVQRSCGSMKSVSVTDLFRSTRRDQSSWVGVRRGYLVRATGSIIRLRKRVFGISRGTISGTRSRQDWAMQGVDIRTIAALMGHKTIQMTMRYAHLAPEHKLVAVERLGSYNS